MVHLRSASFQFWLPRLPPNRQPPRPLAPADLALGLVKAQPHEARAGELYSSCKGLCRVGKLNDARPFWPASIGLPMGSWRVSAFAC